MSRCHEASMDGLGTPGGREVRRCVIEATAGRSTGNRTDSRIRPALCQAKTPVTNAPPGPASRHSFMPALGAYGDGLERRPRFSERVLQAKGHLPASDYRARRDTPRETYPRKARHERPPPGTSPSRKLRQKSIRERSRHDRDQGSEVGHPPPARCAATGARAIPEAGEVRPWPGLAAGSVPHRPAPRDSADRQRPAPAPYSATQSA